MVTPKKGAIRSLPDSSARFIGLFLCVATVVISDDLAAQTITPVTYYVDSGLGNDDNDGLSTGSPWRSLDRVNAASLAAGSKVLFVRGGIWRGQLRPAGSGSQDKRIVYGAYGNTAAARPLLLGSLDKSSTADWQLDSGNIWRSAVTLPIDIGNIIFNWGGSFGTKKWKRSDLLKAGDFYYDLKSRYLYIYATANPASQHNGIELAQTRNIIDQAGRSWLQFQDLALKFGGAHAIGGADTSNNIIQDLEISYIGGGDLYQDSSRQIRYGNGIEFWGNASNHLVQRNKIWEIYDTGITNQVSGQAGAQNDITYKNNLIWNCGFASFEIWNRGTTGAKLANIRLDNNTAYNAGYGWGIQRPDTAGFHLSLDNSTVPITSIYVRNNIFHTSKQNSLLVYDVYQWGSQLLMDYNDWFQPSGAATISLNFDHYYNTSSFSKYQQQWQYDVHSQTVDPQLSNPKAGDLTLRSGSPMIDRGTTTSASNDFLKVGRPKMASFDIGGYERSNP